MCITIFVCLLSFKISFFLVISLSSHFCKCLSYMIMYYVSQ